MNSTFTTSWALIVDDDPDDRCLLNHAFEQVCPRLHCVFASDGEEAVSQLVGMTFPVFMLTDLNMPRQSGMELIKQLKHHPSYRTIPIIMCTTSVSESDRHRCYQAGANAFVSKPNQYSKLVEVISYLVTLWAPSCGFSP